MSFFSNLSTLFGSNQKGGVPKKPVVKPLGKPGLPPQQQPPAPQRAATQPPAPRPQLSAPSEAELQSIIREAQAKAREIIVEAKGEALSLKAKAEQDIRTGSREIEELQRQLNTKLDRIDIRLEEITKRESDLLGQRKGIDDIKVSLENDRLGVVKKLEEVSSMTRDQAKAFLIDNLEQKLNKEMAQIIRQREEEARTEADSLVQEILVDAMKHGATDYVPEYTVSTITLPSEEAKGKIIGKAGRNIHTFERYTGVDVDLDTSPTEVRLSCFDPIRREVARISLERLVKDGRIQPTRIEEVVDKVRSEIDKITFEAGKQLCQEVGVYNLPNDLIKMIGKFKYRFSYGQNLIQHTLEETQIGIKIAHELKADVNVVKLGCLLHDIGKVSGEEEGSHVELGVKIAKKYGIPQSVVDCIEQHHEDVPFTSVEAQIVYIADAISGARPGARYENYDEYVQRLQKLEEIATKYPAVKNAYAIQAGREVRVILDPEDSKDDDVKVLSVKIRDEIKESMTYPGTVTVTVLRETRAQQVAG